MARRVRCGPDVTRGCCLHIYNVYRSPVHRETDYLIDSTRVPYILTTSHDLFLVGLKLLSFLYFQDAWCNRERWMSGAMNRARGSSGHTVHAIKK